MPVTQVHESVIQSDNVTSIKNELEAARAGSGSLLERLNSFSSSVDAATISAKLLAATTNLKLDHYKQSIRNEMSELVIDCFEDASGIDAVKSSNYVKTVVATDDCVKSADGNTAHLVSVAEQLVAKPSVIILSVQEVLNTGSIAYDASLDDGVTWFSLAKGAATNVPAAQAVSNPVMLRTRAAINADAQLNGWACGWK